MTTATGRSEKIYTDELNSPGYVWFRCDVYGLPDNTMGKTGYHVVYRPLADGYQGHEHVTEQMRADVRALYADRQRQEAEKETAAFVAAPVTAPAPLSPYEQEYVNRYRTSEAAWAAEDEEAWAVLRRLGR